MGSLARAVTSRERGYIVFDALDLAAGAALYAANNALVKPLRLPGLLGVFFGGHFNDVVAGFAFLAYTNILFDLVKPSLRIKHFCITGLYALCCGLFWEVVAPALFKPSTSDPWDLLCYVVGALVYWAANVACDRRTSRSA